MRLAALGWTLLMLAVTAAASPPKVDRSINATSTGFRARVPWSGIRAEFSTNGVFRIAGKSNVTVRLGALGRGANLRAVPAANAGKVGEDKSGAPRLTFGRPGVQEWYVNSKAGLRQWFQVDQRPNGTGDLTLALPVTGAQPTAQSEQLINLRNDAGKSIAQYGDIKAWDAKGRKLPAKLDAAKGSIYLRVDDAGAAYPVTIDPVWSQTQTLTASTPFTYGGYGYSVDVSGDHAIVGSTTGGFIYFYQRTGGTWNEVSFFNGGNGFGTSVAIDGDYVIAGGIGASVRIFHYESGSWVDQGVVASHAHSVDIQGDTAVVGDASNEVAYIFKRNGSTWDYLDTLFDGDGNSGDYYGGSVSIDGDRIAVASSTADDGATDAGAVWLYQFDHVNGYYYPFQKILPPTPTNGQRFGYDVSLSGDAIAISAFNDLGPSGWGTTSIFRLNGFTWTREARLQGGAPTGGSVCLKGDRLVAGDPYAGPTGVVYVFDRTSPGTWTTQSVVAPLAFSDGDNYGVDVAFDGPTLFAGAYNTTVGLEDDAGAVYVFHDDGFMMQTSAAWRTGGKPVDVTIKLYDPVPGATTILLFSTDPALSVPSSVVVPDGQQQVTFQANCAVVASDVDATVYAVLYGVNESVQISVRAPRVGRIDLAAGGLDALGTTTGTVVLNGPAPTGGLVVPLVASPPNAVTIPTHVVVPAGQTRANFTITAKAVDSDTPVTITATPSYVPKTASLLVYAGLAPALYPTYASMEVGSTQLVTVMLSRPAPSTQQVTLSYTGPFSGPSTVIYASGENEYNAIVTAGASAGSGYIFATTGTKFAYVPITVQKPVLTTISLSSSTMGSAQTITGTVHLEKPAPGTGVLVTLSASKPGQVTMPATVTVPAGQTTAQFSITANTISSARVIAIIGKTRLGGNRGTNLILVP